MTYQQRGSYNIKVRSYRDVIFRDLVQRKLTSAITQTVQKDVPRLSRPLGRYISEDMFCNRGKRGPEIMRDQP